MIYSRFTFFYSGIFSQWHRCRFTVDDTEYNCAEQFMMVQKANLFSDAEIAKRILEEKHPAEQKALGRKVRNFDVAKWNAVARDLVYKGNYAKFEQNKYLSDALDETHGTLLVEASPTDCVWGVGLRETDAKIHDEKLWRGTNWLGQVLTRVREDMEAGIYRTENFEKIWHLWSQVG